MTEDTVTIRTRAQNTTPIDSLMHGSDDDKLVIYHRGRRWEESAFYWRARVDVLAMCDEIDRLAALLDAYESDGEDKKDR